MAQQTAVNPTQELRTKYLALIESVKTVKAEDTKCVHGYCTANVGQECIYGTGPTLRSAPHDGRFEKARDEALAALAELFDDIVSQGFENGLDAGAAGY